MKDLRLMIFATEDPKVVTRLLEKYCSILEELDPKNRFDQIQAFDPKGCLDVLNKFSVEFKLFFDKTKEFASGKKQIAFFNLVEDMMSSGREYFKDEEEWVEGKPPPRILRAEKILQSRTSRILLVLPNIRYQAHLRTAEIFGIQDVWILNPEVLEFTRISKMAQKWLSMRYFGDAEDLIKQLREEGREIWAYSPRGIEQREEGPQKDEPELIEDLMCSSELPERVALVLNGEKQDNPMEAKLTQAASKLITLSHIGMSDGPFRSSDATAMLLQAMFLWCPEARGQMDPQRRQALRHTMFTKLSEKMSTARQDICKSYIKSPPVVLSEGFEMRREKQVRVPKKIARRLDYKQGFARCSKGKIFSE